MQAMPAEHPARRRPSWKQFLAVAMALVVGGVVLEKYMARQGSWGKGCTVLRGAAREDAQLELTVRQYLQAFEHKDLDALGPYFADNVELRDWEGSDFGKEKVLAANQKLFDGFGKIEVQVKNMIVSSKDRAVAAEFLLKLHPKEGGKEAKVIPVTDIIKLGGAASGSKITSVKAYKRSNKTI